MYNSKLRRLNRKLLNKSIGLEDIILTKVAIRRTDLTRAIRMTIVRNNHINTKFDLYIHYKPLEDFSI